MSEYTKYMYLCQTSQNITIAIRSFGYHIKSLNINDEYIINVSGNSGGCVREYITDSFCSMAKTEDGEGLYIYICDEFGEGCFKGDTSSVMWILGD